MKTPSAMHKTVCVIGPFQLQNELITHHLEAQAGVRCLAAASFDEARSRLGDGYDQIALFLWDCAEKDLALEITGLNGIADLLPNDSFLGLLNVERKRWEHDTTLPAHVKGVFFDESSVEDFVRGVSCILDGESWLPFDKMVHDPAAGGASIGNGDSWEELITPREKSILSLIEQGKSNQQIADTFGVTYKTIKNHTNNLFRKMNVSNRFQAALRTKRR